MATSPRLSAMGLPTLRVSSRASSSACASTCSAKRRSSRVRSAGATSRQAGKAPRGARHGGVGCLLALAVDLGDGAARSPGSRPARFPPGDAPRQWAATVTPTASTQGREETPVAVLLRVPLHADDETRRRQLDSLDEPVGRPAP